MNKIITIQIGNSDDKLTQKQWAAFVKEMDEVIESYSTKHFFATSDNTKPWQNACWVVEVCENCYKLLKDRVSVVRIRYNQNSAAWTEGLTLFI